MRLTVWAIAGTFLAASTGLLVFVHVPRLSASGHGSDALLWGNRLRIVVYFVPLVFGMLISWRAENRLKQGATGDVWSKIELAPVRGLLANRIWNWMNRTVLAAYLFLLIFICLRSGRFADVGLLYLLLLPGQTVMRLKQIVALPVVNRGGLRDWHSFQPIQSEHWGEPKQVEDASLLRS